MGDSGFEDIRFMNKVGLLMIFTGLITFLYSFPEIVLKGYVYHGFTIGAYSIPLFVSGVYFHMIPGYNRRGANKYLVISPYLAFIASFILFLIDLLTLSILALSFSFLSIVFVIFLCGKPIMGKFYYQKLIAITSYFMAFTSALLMILIPGLSLIHSSFSIMFSVAVGMIFAVNSLSIPKTYKLEPRGVLSIPISILLAMSVITVLYYFKNMFVTTLMLAYVMYLSLIKIEKMPQWFKGIENFTEVSKKIHINLIIGHIIHVIILPISITLLLFNYLNFVDFIHVIAFGFILPQITAHGPVLIPPILKKKPRIPRKLYILSLSTTIPTFLRILGHRTEAFNSFSGAIALLIILILPLSILKSGKAPNNRKKMFGEK